MDHHPSLLWALWKPSAAGVWKESVLVSSCQDSILSLLGLIYLYGNLGEGGKEPKTFTLVSLYSLSLTVSIFLSLGNGRESLLSKVFYVSESPSQISISFALEQK